MNNIHSDSSPSDVEELLGEYTFDYKKVKPNRFVNQDSRSKMTVVVLDEDIAQVFSSAELVNQALRQLIKAMP